MWSVDGSTLCESYLKFQHGAKSAVFFVNRLSRCHSGAQKAIGMKFYDGITSLLVDLMFGFASVDQGF